LEGRGSLTADFKRRLAKQFRAGEAAGKTLTRLILQSL